MGWDPPLQPPPDRATSKRGAEEPGLRKQTTSLCSCHRYSVDDDSTRELQELMPESTQNGAWHDRKGEAGIW